MTIVFFFKCGHQFYFPAQPVGGSAHSDSPSGRLSSSFSGTLAVPLAVPIAGTLSLSGVLGRRGSIGVFLLPYEMLLFM